MNDFQSIKLNTKLWIIALIIGLILCFCGGQVFLQSLFIFGFLALAVPGYILCSQAYGIRGGIFGLIACGIIGGILFIAAYHVGIFALGFVVGGALGLILTGDLFLPAILGIITGIVFVIFSGEFIILGTALLGAYIVCESLFVLILPGWEVAPEMNFVFKLIIFVLGMLFQLGLQGRH